MAADVAEAVGDQAAEAVVEAAAAVAVAVVVVVAVAAVAVVDVPGRLNRLLTGAYRSGYELRGKDLGLSAIRRESAISLHEEEWRRDC